MLDIQITEGASMTDVERWKKTALEVPKWDERNKLFAQILAQLNVNKIVDFGAGNQTLRNYVKDIELYVPIDCVKSTPDTFLVDFNATFSLPKFPTGPNASFVFSGFLEYIEDLDAFFKNLKVHAPNQNCVFSYAVHPRESERRASNGWLNDLGEEDDVCSYFVSQFVSLQCYGAWWGQLLFSGRLRES